MPEVFDRTDLTPRERRLAAFETPAASGHALVPLSPFIAASVEITDPAHPARKRAREYKTCVAERLTEAARQAGAADPERLGEQLALLLDGASARTQALGANAGPTAAEIAAALIEQAIPTTAPARPLAKKEKKRRRRADAVAASAD